MAPSSPLVPPSHPHTKALLSYLLATYPRKPTSSTANATSPAKPPSALTPAKLSTLLSQVSFDQPLSNKAAALSTSSVNADGDKPSANGEEQSSTASSSASTDGEGVETDDVKMGKVIALLENKAVDDDDKPEALKVLLASLLSDSEPLDLDPKILALLHRHREDVEPSGNPLPPLSVPRPSVSRSSSFRRTFSNGALSLSNSRSTTPTPSVKGSNGGAGGYTSSASSTLGSAPTSPNRTSSPLPPPPGLHSSSHTPSHSPWSSPRLAPRTMHLSAGAPEFKFSAGAADFTPSFGGAAASGSVRSLSRPGTPHLPRTPGTPKVIDPHQAQAAWAASSPLGTPKYEQSYGGPASHPGSALSSPSYFSRDLEAGVQKQLLQNKMTRLPWAEATTDSSSGGSVVDDFVDDEDEENPEPRKEYNYIHSQQAMAEQQALRQPPQQQQHQYLADQQASEWGDGQYGSAALAPEFVSVALAQQWDPFGESGYQSEGEGGGVGGAYGEEGAYTPTHGGGSNGLHGDPSTQAFQAAIGGHQAGLGASIGAYVFTPFDHLHSVFAGSDISAAFLEEALVMTGFDVDLAIEYIIDTQPGGPNARPPPGMGMMMAGGPPPGLLAPDGSFIPQMQPPPRTVVASGSRPMIVSRDSFDGFVGGNGGRGTPGGGGGGAPRWNSRPGTPSGDGGRGGGAGGGGGGGVGGRVCRYYLSGNCLRSDCKFSHDVGKAVCKFWLRGHCLKGDDRCDFLHSIPPIMRADFEQRARRRSASNAAPEEVVLDDSGPDLDFPSLGEAPRSRRQGQGRHHVQLDPTRTRFSGAVKFGSRTIDPRIPPLPRAPPPPPVPTREMLPQPRFSARINLRPPALLPTLPTGTALAALYAQYRASFLELGANRNKCLARAAECWKRGDGAGARKWSRDAADWNRQVAIEGRDSARRIVEERKRLMKEAIGRNEGRAGSTDDAPDRKVRGREIGGGVCLGVVSTAILPRSGVPLTVDERTEVALDLHGLHFDEASSFLGDFLVALERERFSGLAFIVIGQAKHTGASDGDRGAAAGRLRLEQGCTEFLSSQGWPWSIRSGIITVDPLR